MSFILHSFILLALLCVGCMSAPMEDVENPVILVEPENYRLPTTIMPNSYHLTFRPYLLESDGSRRFTFDGEAFINVTVKENTTVIIMHTKNLNYTVREFWLSTGSNPQPRTLTNFSLNSVTDQITYVLNSNLNEGANYTLHFKYIGSMDDDMYGFYRSSYKDENNQTKWIGSTQFEQHYARRAFPSFDEPRFKATFDINIIRHKSMNSVSNGELLESIRDGDYYKDTFDRTPKMSSYLVAFLVSDFNERWNGQFGVIARPQNYDQTEYTFSVGPKILEALGIYLDIPYYQMGVRKLHMAAIPDFDAGAMENWGLITYREISLLYKEGETNLNDKQYIAEVTAHEQTHLWFGDLVTCAWWSYAWLNEGFARYFQYFGTALVETEWSFDKQFPVDQIQTVMILDSTNKTNPMSDENTNTPSEYLRMFNTITYNKGGSIIRMIKHAMGEQNFQNSLREYLKTYAFQNVVPTNLLGIWEKHWPAQTKNYAPLVFKSFTEQVGYPVVKFNVSTANKQMSISQKRFLLNSNDGSDINLLYTVPITYTTNLNKDFTSTSPNLYLDASTNTKTHTLPDGVEWVVANIQQTGYYRVNYDVDNWHKLHKALTTQNWGGIHEMNRAQIVDDLLNLARAGEIEYQLALDVLQYLSTEDNYLPWTAAFNGYEYLLTRLGSDTKYFGHYIRQLTEHAYNKLGFEEKSTDNNLDIYNRAKILSWSCKFGNSECITKAKSYFNNMHNSPVPVNIRSAVYCTAMREGNENDFNILYNKLKSSSVATEEVLILKTLGCVKEPKLVEKYFWIIVSDDVRRQDKLTAISSLYSQNNENLSPVFRLVTTNLEDLVKSMGDYSNVASVIASIAARFTEESQKNELETFNTNNKAKFGESASTLETAEKTVAINLAWSDRNMGTFKQYLEKRENGSNTARAFTSLFLTLVAVLLWC